MKRRLKYILITALLFSAMLSSLTVAYAREEDDVIGTIDELVTGMNDPNSLVSGTDLGYVIADAVMDAAGTDLAIVNGGDISQNLQPGEITWGEVVALFTENRTIAVVQITPSELKDILEIAVSSLVTDENDAIDQEASAYDGFIQPAGFTYKCDASAAVGDRILKITLESTGEELDLTDSTTLYTLAATEYMLSGGYSMPEYEYDSTDLTLAEALALAIENGSISTSSTDRVKIIGTTDSSLISYVPAGIIVIAAVLIGLFNYKKNRDYDHTRYNHHNEKGYERKKYIKN